MVNYISFVLIAMASIAIAESRVIPTEPISVTLDTYDNPVMFLREKRTAVRPYPHRTMMFTGYYRPIRRTNNSGQATGVFAQGNAVSGEAFFGGMHTPHLKGGPEPIEESEVSSAEAQAAPAPEEQEREYHRNEVHRPEEEQHHEHHDEEEQLHPDDHYHQDSLTPQGHHELEQIPLTTEIAQPTEKPFTATEASRPKIHHTKKTHKTPVTINTDDDDDDEDEVDDEEDDEPVVPFVPFKGNRRRQKYPHLNNFFPMVFSFPRLATRAGSSGSVPGAITAIANSYSTGKGGVASSVATAYGGSPTGMSRILLFVALLVAVVVALPAPQLQESAICIEIHIYYNSEYIKLGYTIIESIQNITSHNFFNLTDETISVNKPEQLKELIAAYEVNLQLSSIIEQLVQEQSRIKNDKFNNTDSTLQALNNVNNIKGLINTIKEIDTQDEEITNEHVRIKRAVTFATSEEWMTNMLIDIQRQVVHIRKYLDKLCKFSFVRMELDSLCKLYKKLTTNSSQQQVGRSISIGRRPQSRPAVERIDRTIFRELLHNTFHVITEDILVERLFCCWDREIEGAIRLEPWIMGLDVFLRGSLRDKIVFCFHVYDLNNDGYITKDEIFQLLKNCLIKQPGEEDPDEGVKDLSELALKKFDVDHDGKISFRDYETAVIEEPLLLEAFGQCLPTDESCADFLVTLQS
ncbi:EF-hand calcium-binding domain-containing protein 1 [Atta colombica]|uniref:EF-hand calcium-binding domain-containing protein 1 n=1 Tax=Atta colombica TaxID=520822 RepID=A0A195BU40_9HYME|nr:EF-hand calcium-binding domain-containing protein 1 [Atta colombica]